MNRILIPLFVIVAAFLCGAASAGETGPTLDHARAALKAHDPAAAAALLEPLTTTDPADAPACALLSQVRLAQRNAKDAVALAQKATTLDPSKAAYFSQLGMALGQYIGQVPVMEQPMMAARLRKAFAKAVELDPHDMAGLIGLARFYVNAPEIAGGSLEKAREYASRVREIDPFTGELELGNIEEQDAKTAEALAHFEAAAKLRPTHDGAQFLCGQALVKLGRKEEARRRFEAALKANPEHAGARKALAELDAPAS